MKQLYSCQFSLEIRWFYLTELIGSTVAEVVDVPLGLMLKIKITVNRGFFFNVLVVSKRYEYWFKNIHSLLEYLILFLSEFPD